VVLDVCGADTVRIGRGGCSPPTDLPFQFCCSLRRRDRPAFEGRSTRGNAAEH
jgi:hypothetical protein